MTEKNMKYELTLNDEERKALALLSGHVQVDLIDIMGKDVKLIAHALAKQELLILLYDSLGMIKVPKSHTIELMPRWMWIYPSEIKKTAKNSHSSLLYWRLFIDDDFRNAFIDEINRITGVTGKEIGGEDWIVIWKM